MKYITILFRYFIKAIRLIFNNNNTPKKHRCFNCHGDNSEKLLVTLDDSDKFRIYVCDKCKEVMDSNNFNKLKIIASLEDLKYLGIIKDDEIEAY